MNNISTPVAGSCRAFPAEGASLRIESAEGSRLIVRKNGQIFCYKNRCPHTGTELDWSPGVFLDPSREYIQCATHGALFEIETGECVYGPCLGSRLETVLAAQD